MHVEKIVIKDRLGHNSQKKKIVHKNFVIKTLHLKTKSLDNCLHT